MKDLQYELAARTDRGQKRSLNEDSVATLDLPRCSVAFVVADGMGGLRAGDIASREALRVVTEVLQQSLATTHTPVLETIRLAMVAANDAVNALARPDSPATENDAPTVRSGETATSSDALMGTTLVVGIVRDAVLYIGHAGDSRAYRVRGRVLDRLTEDHSYVAEQVKAGNLTEEEARRSRFRNVITRAVGIDTTLEPELRAEPLRAGDWILACSDGLTTMLTDEEITAQVTHPKFAKQSADEQALALIEAANRRGGHDNITVCCLRVIGEEPAPTKNVPVKSAAMAMPTPEEPDTPSLPTPSRAKRQVGGCLSLLMIPLAIVGAAAIAGMLAVAFSPGVQATVATRLGASVPPTLYNPLGMNDFNFLQYEKPRPFVKDLILRGDILDYVPGTGLFGVLSSRGSVVLMDRQGKLIGSRSVYPLPVRPYEEKTAVWKAYSTTDPAGNIYLSLPHARFIQKVSPDGRVLATIGGFERPEAVTLDETGNLYVVDNERLKIVVARRSTDVIVPTPRPIVTIATPTPKATPKPR
jgi:protein phosphatase